MPSVLILAYGNPIRGDDGIAWRAAQELEKVLPPPVAEIVRLHQLAPELAEQASHADTVIFLDANCDGPPGAIRCLPVGPQPGDPRFSHQFTPQSLMALCERLYSARPAAFAVSLAGESFGVGDQLSRAATRALPQLVRAVQELADAHGSAGVPAGILRPR